MSKNWACVALNTGHPMDGHDARRAVTSGRRELAHHIADGPKVGDPAEGPAPVRFLGRRNGFAMIGFGDAGIQLVHQHAPEIGREWSARHGTPVSFNCSSGTCTASALPYLRRYRIDRCVVQKKNHHRGDDGGVPVDHVERLIQRGLITHAALLGIDIPELTGLRVLGKQRVTAIPLGHGGVALETWCGLEFEAPVALYGWWAAGYLQSRGHGHFNADMQRSERLMDGAP